MTYDPRLRGGPAPGEAGGQMPVGTAMGSDRARHSAPAGTGTPAGGEVYAALDLGTNNCRLLIACPTGDSFRVIDSFSRIIRLGEGISSTGCISEAAMERAIAAL